MSVRDDVVRDLPAGFVKDLRNKIASGEIVLEEGVDVAKAVREVRTYLDVMRASDTRLKEALDVDDTEIRDALLKAMAEVGIKEKAT